MTPAAERRLARGFWALAGLIFAAALAIGGIALLHPPALRPLPEDAAKVEKPLPQLSQAEIDAFARQAMSRAVVKAAPPAPPKLVVTPLDLLIRLSGIINYGPGSPPEAFIEIRSSTETKGYKEGDSLGNVKAVVKSVSDAVVLEYDGQLWKLTERGVQALSATAVSTASGAKP